MHITRVFTNPRTRGSELSRAKKIQSLLISDSSETMRQERSFLRCETARTSSLISVDPLNRLASSYTENKSVLCKIPNHKQNSQK